MEPTSLSNLYDDLKKEVNQPAQPMLHVGFGPAGMNPDAIAWRHKAAKHCGELKDKCRKHILMDIYCKILPLDDDYKCGHMGKMSGDIDNMLAAKGMGPTEYFTSCFESTGAPFVKWMLDATDEIGRQYMEKQDETLKDGQEANIDLPDPEEPDTEDPEVKSQLVDIESDMEYNDFVEKLKKKTIDKIVDDVSAIIAGEQQGNDMTFDPVQESTVLTAMDYMQKKFWNESTDLDQMIGLAIREAALHEFDCVFNLQGKTFNEYSNRIRLGKGYVINESALTTFAQENKPVEKKVEEIEDQFKKVASSEPKEN